MFRNLKFAILSYFVVVYWVLFLDGHPAQLCMNTHISSSLLIFCWGMFVPRTFGIIIRTVALVKMLPR